MEPEEWDLKTHRIFVETIFMEGMRKCSPSVILKNMTIQEHLDDEVTLERVKSHLQKFRSNKKKSLAEFLFSYDIALATYRRFLGSGEEQDLLTIAKKCSISDLDQLSPTIAESKKGVLLSGEVAAYLTLASILSPETNLPSENLSSSSTDKKERSSRTTNSTRMKCDELALSNPPMFMMYCNEGYGPTSIQLPTLTGDEKEGPFGALMCYILGNFSALTQLIIENRNEKARGSMDVIGDKPEGKEPERKEPEGKEPERKEPEGKEPERKEPEGKEPERKEHVTRTQSELSNKSRQDLISNPRDPPREEIAQGNMSYSMKRPASTLASRSNLYIKRDAYGIPYLPLGSDISSRQIDHHGVPTANSFLDHSEHSLNSVLNSELALEIERSFDGPKPTTNAATLYGKGNIQVTKDPNTNPSHNVRESNMAWDTTSHSQRNLVENMSISSSDIAMPKKKTSNRGQYSNEVPVQERHFQEQNYEFTKHPAQDNANHSRHTYPATRTGRSDRAMKQTQSEASRSYESNSSMSYHSHSGSERKKRAAEDDHNKCPKSHKK